jgi:hypothetical protein
MREMSIGEGLRPTSAKVPKGFEKGNHVYLDANTRGFATAFATPLV